MASIVPLSYNLPPIGSDKNDLAPVFGEQGDGKKTFTDYLFEAVENVEYLEQVKENDSYLLSIGEVDNIAAMQINTQKAEIAVSLMIQMRNKLTDAYSEIMRMSI